MELENLEKSIAKLESIDSSSEYAYEKALLAFISIKQLPVLIYTLPAGTFLFRTRTHNDEVFFNSIDDINLPPSQLIKDFPPLPPSSTLVVLGNIPSKCLF